MLAQRTAGGKLAGDLLVALSRCLEGRDGGPVTNAAARYDRAARAPWDADEPDEPEDWIDLRFLARPLSDAGRRGWRR